tara:strand:- start:47 stop:505 length:459 start_codon:yes stop_codon:yes gene_type:complete
MKKILYTILLIVPFLFVTSCEKDVNGCTNSNATNYSSEANIDNNSCEFEATVMINKSEVIAEINVLVDVTLARYYVNGEYIGEMNGSTYFITPPDCDFYNSIPSTKINLGNNTLGSFEFSTIYYINGQYGGISGPYTYSINANECKTISVGF